MHLSVVCPLKLSHSIIFYHTTKVSTIIRFIIIHYYYYDFPPEVPMAVHHPFTSFIITTVSSAAGAHGNANPLILALCTPLHRCPWQSAVCLYSNHTVLFGSTYNNDIWSGNSLARIKCGRCIVWSYSWSYNGCYQVYLW